MPLHDGLAGANQRFSIAERMGQDRGKVMYVQCISIFQSPCFGGNLPLISRRRGPSGVVRVGTSPDTIRPGGSSGGASRHGLWQLSKSELGREGIILDHYKDHQRSRMI